jgi:hypothetical protein
MSDCVVVPKIEVRRMGGEISIDIPGHGKLTMSTAEAIELSAALRAVANVESNSRLELKGRLQ